ncbi:YpjP family protein [Viridibacillus sp. FSL R5-0468]|uniref:YpjP family protein n=1 Tax=Viridibacillus sp. FSL R5-0468 TaxID=2921640 RepID=UPI0030F5F944
MKKIFKKISILLVLALLVQVTLPFASLANSNDEIETFKQETNSTDKDIQLGLKIISDNRDMLLEDVDHEILDSYGIENQDIALLKYYFNNSSSTGFNDDVQIETRDAISIEPHLGAVVVSTVRALVAKSVKKKMGKKIEKQIGKEVESKVVTRMQDEAEKQVKKYGYSKFIGPEGSGANGIRQGEHIFEIIGDGGFPIMRGHVNLEESNTLSIWHWHKKQDDFEYHHGQIRIKSNSLPKWGSK